VSVEPKMSNQGYAVFIISFLTILSISIGLWLNPINLKPDHIPSILEGLISSISIIVGFTGTILAIVLQSKDFKLSRRDLSRALLLMMAPVVLLVVMYLHLVQYGNLQDALRIATSTLVVAFFIFFGLINFLYKKL